ncbi:HPr family phosphocarrier protein [Paramaledivibacter caminithermalis]|uniref:Phosphocarrier protein HPr n=1 Tax=Paramaledivibacter caminithermalis (strain DSM 15212 / CIP 107654 / DViRD3) TaxID=1121301 RepID=A0A1M6RGM4_PARC5|nr:HPr family phosphocarrier protein [Paramaledivibacter caminithermalis]SHK31543.1 phosphocarrier protein [Paramaledivibacter caminithermalis DSM 15212]
MYKKEVVVKNENGLHARPASLFIQKASKFKSEINLQIGDKSIDAKSILAVLSAGIRCNSKITISAVGEDEKQAVQELIKFIETCKADSVK